LPYISFFPETSKTLPLMATYMGLEGSLPSYWAS
jgi:hypothetical protein